jgi:hypothetical protein
VGDGELLIGDGVTPGIVRVGDTVRRPLRPFSLTVQAYLAHLRDAGFTGAPLPFGVDEQGREVLSFVPGDVPRPPAMRHRPATPSARSRDGSSSGRPPVPELASGSHRDTAGPRQSPTA